MEYYILKVKRSDYFLRYIKLAPIQLSLVRSQEAYQMAKIPMARPILDIGASDGIFGSVLMKGKKNSIDVGIDIDEKALSRAKEKGIYKKLMRVNAKKMPFSDKSFATVISNQSLEHIKGVEKAIKEVSRVLKSRGMFIFLVPTIYLNNFWLAPGSLYDLRNKIFQHHNLWPRERWEKLLKRNGFKIINFQYIGNKRVYLISEVLWPLRLPTLFLSKIFNKEILFEELYRLKIANIIVKLLNLNDVKDADNGPTMLIIAQKK